MSSYFCFLGLREVEKNEKDFYGTGTVSSHAPEPESDDDVEQNLEDVIGNPPPKEFNLGEAVNQDMQDMHGASDEETEAEDEDETPKLGNVSEDELPEVKNEADEDPLRDK